MNINKNSIIKFSELFNNNDKNKLAKNAVTSSKLKDIILDRNHAQKHNRIFSNRINVETEPSDQQKSGRCWLFALSNMLRLKLIKKYTLDKSMKFELSMAYLSFFDKLEKSNYFLSLICKYRKEPINSRNNSIFLKEPVSDGGNWNMILNLINKYGIVPRSCFNETEHSTNTHHLDNFLNNKLKDYAFVIRTLDDTEYKNINTYIQKFMTEIYKILVIFLGEPPQVFNWEYISNKKYTIKKNITPLDFYKKYVGVNLDNYILLANNPCVKFNKHFTIHDFNNMKDGREIAYINVGMDVIKQAIKKSIDNNDALWFGCDVDKYIHSGMGVLDPKMINYKTVFDTDISLNKKNRLQYQLSDVTHAMIIRGYDNNTNQTHKCRQVNTRKLKNRNRKGEKTKSRSCNKSKKTVISSNPIKTYLVENSWGKQNKGDENLVMTDEYLDEYVYIVAVDKKYIGKDVLKLSKQPPSRFNIWDPFGYLLF